MYSRVQTYLRTRKHKNNRAKQVNDSDQRERIRKKKRKKKKRNGKKRKEFIEYSIFYIASTKKKLDLKPTRKINPWNSKRYNHSLHRTFTAKQQRTTVA